MESFGFSHARVPFSEFLVFPSLSSGPVIFQMKQRPVRVGQPSKMSDLTLGLPIPLESEDSEIWVRQGTGGPLEDLHL